MPESKVTAVQVDMELAERLLKVVMVATGYPIEGIALLVAVLDLIREQQKMSLEMFLDLVQKLVVAKAMNQMVAVSGAPEGAPKH